MLVPQRVCRPAKRTETRGSAQRRHTPRWPIIWTDGSLTAVSSEEIARMTRSELEGYVYAAGRQFLGPQILERLKFQDRATLLRLAHLGRYCCRNRLRRRREAGVELHA